ncbi:Rab-like small GTPase [Fragilaria crotonensis]|nr:Rab-like small GTPase [Fragilaria crotonensis]
MLATAHHSSTRQNGLKMFAPNEGTTLSFVSLVIKPIWATTRDKSQPRKAKNVPKDGLMFMECSAKAGYNVKSLFRKLATALPGSPDGAGNGAVGGGAPGNSNLIDIKLSAAPANLDDSKPCGC